MFSTNSENDKVQEIKVEIVMNFSGSIFVFPPRRCYCAVDSCLLAVTYSCRSFGSYALLVVNAQLCDILFICLPDMESRCLITHVWLCWEHPAHLYSNELHETDCFFILHLTLQQKCPNKTVPPLTGYIYPSEAPEEQVAPMRSLKVA